MMGTEATFATESDRRKPQSVLLNGSSALGLLETKPYDRQALGDQKSKRAVVAPSTESAKRSLEERLFDALADAKVWTSKVAMHLDRTSRDRYFRQLDRLHDTEEWFGDDSPLNLSSYKGFIRFMLMIGGCSKPSLALSPSGYLMAVWEVDGARLTVDFRSETEVAWVMSHIVNGAPERIGGRTVFERLLINLQPFSPAKWFNLAS